MKTFRYFFPVAVLLIWVCMMASASKAFAQVSGDINKNPTIIMDQRAIAIDRNILKAAKEGKDAGRIKAASERLKHDVAKLKSDRVALKRAKKK